MATLTSASRVVRSEGFITSTVDNELVMMSLEKGTYYGLDAIGSQIWENIATPITIEALCQKLIDQFEVDPAQCQADVLAFLNELHQEDMVHEAS
ncbi:MAG: lasso peptide biosynthesis PqqD family chaperone [Ardenticatenaceae bacterium]|nr:lasso peptide biosynthesis PqqD family chaperone [Anaerolineales bacterium]MCB8981230.1 lasso peptide biosynthesis PqqD family chaperone [Ardenticatenaceae bacterium]